MSDKKIKSVMCEVDYGIINLKLDDLLKKRNISTYELSTKANVRFQTIQALRENTSSRIDFEVLAKLCYVLECKVADLLEYTDKK